MTIEALVGLTLIAVASLALLVDRAATPLTAIDSLTFHLPVVGSWIQDGSIWGVWQFTPDLANGNYPQNGDVAQLAVVLPFDNDAFVRLVSAPLFTATGVAAFALGRELGASPSSSALAAALVLAIPSVLEPALLQGQTDVFMPRHAGDWDAVPAPFLEDSSPQRPRSGRDRTRARLRHEVVRSRDGGGHRRGLARRGAGRLAARRRQAAPAARAGHVAGRKSVFWLAASGWSATSSSRAIRCSRRRSGWAA